MVSAAYVITWMETPAHVMLAYSRLYTLISKFTDQIHPTPPLPTDNWPNGPYSGGSATPGIA
jgi:hypothetical protein